MAPSYASPLPARRAATTLLFSCAIPLLFSLQRTTAWSTPPTRTAVRRSFVAQARRSANGDFASDVERLGQPLHHPAGQRIVANGWRGKHSCRTYRMGPAVAAASASSASNEVSSGEEGYTLGEAGKCELEALPPLKNRYYALRHGQSVANM